MKFGLLSGAYINAGDFLIVERTKALLLKIFPDCEIVEYLRNKALDNQVEEINKLDALIVAGGPAYMTYIYPNIIPLVDDLSKITTKIIPIGVGWYGENTKSDYVYNYYKFTDKTLKFLKRMETDAGFLSCRDYFSCRILNNNGLFNFKLTGCPAWYNLKKIDIVTPKKLKIKDINKIYISDPANIKNLKQIPKLIEYLKAKFNNAQIIFVFHRRSEGNGAEKEYMKCEEYLANNDIEYIDISSSSKGFECYNDADLHIGYRVHAHIYNLSERNLSILIEEDGRGAGVNEVLGMAHIYAYNPYKTGKNYYIFNDFLSKIKRKVLRFKKYYDNEFLLEELDAWIKICFNNDLESFSLAYKKMQATYYEMEKFIKNTLEKTNDR